MRVGAFAKATWAPRAALFVVLLDLSNSKMLHIYILRGFCGKSAIAKLETDTVGANTKSNGS